MGSVFFYVVRNGDGKYFRAKGYQGYGESWVEGLDKARVWAKLSGARSVVTYFANAWPGYSVPDIVELTVTATEVLDEKDRVEKAKVKKKKAKETQELHNKREALKHAQAAYEQAQANLEKLK